MLEQLFAIHFLLVSCIVCRMVIPKICASTQGSGYWQLVHCMHCASCDFSDGSCASFQLHPTEVLNPAVLILFHETNSGFIFYWQCRLSVLSLKEYL